MRNMICTWLETGGFFAVNDDEFMNLAQSPSKEISGFRARKSLITFSSHRSPSSQMYLFFDNSSTVVQKSEGTKPWSLLQSRGCP